MANRYYGVSVGGAMPTEVTEGSSSTSKDIELVVNMAATGISKRALLDAVEALEYKITTDNWPPA